MAPPPPPPPATVPPATTLPSPPLRSRCSPLRMKATPERPAQLWFVAALLVAIAGNTAAAGGDDEINTYEGYVLLETQPLSDSQAHALAEAGGTWDFWEAPRESARAIVFAAPEEAPSVERALQTLGVQFQNSWIPQGAQGAQGAGRRRNATSIRDRRALRAISFTRFHRLIDIHEYLDDLAKQYPELVSVFSIGSSLEGRDLKVIRISSDRGRRFKPAVFIDAAIHAREWISPPVALYTILQLVENYNANRDLVDQLDWYILPVLNPDGYEYTFTNERFWRKTRSYNDKRRCFGTDINRNFPIHWREGDASADPCSLTFSGEEAFSEPETRAFARFVRKLAPRLRLYLTLHSYGQLLLFPWGFTSELPHDAEELNGKRFKSKSSVVLLWPVSNGLMSPGINNMPLLHLELGQRINIHHLSKSDRPIPSDRILGKQLDKLIDNLKLEMHIPGYSYCGPGTQLEDRLAEGDPGKNALDAACREHDIAYRDYPELSNRISADKVLLKKAWSRIVSKDASLGEREAALLVATAMKIAIKIWQRQQVTGSTGTGNGQQEFIQNGDEQIIQYPIDELPADSESRIDGMKQNYEQIKPETENSDDGVHVRTKSLQKVKHEKLSSRILRGFVEDKLAQ